MRMKLRFGTLIVFFFIIAVGIEAVWAKEYSLTVGDQRFSKSTIDAYGKRMIRRQNYCPPYSDKFVLDSFINSVLLVREARDSERELHNQAINLALKPYNAQIAKIERFKQKHDQKSVAVKVYQKQIKRHKDWMEDISLKMESNYLYRTTFDIESNNRIAYQSDLTEKDKQLLVDMKGFVSLFESRIRSQISDEMVQLRYDELLEAKDKRVTDVYVFLSGSIPQMSIDESSIAKGVEFIKSILDSSENFVRTPEGTVLPNPTSWSLLEHVNEVQEDLAKITIGSKMIEKYDDRMTPDGRQIYRLTYIHDIKHFSTIGLFETTGRGLTTPSHIIREELYDELMETARDKLWLQSKVLFNGEVIAKASNYTPCPSD